MTIMNGNLLLLNPSMIDELHLTLESFAVVRTVQGQLLLRCSADSGVDPTCVGIPAFTTLYRHYASSEVDVELYRSAALVADKVVLTPSLYKEFMDTVSFKDYLRKELGPYFYMREGLVMNFCYLGFHCSFTVKSIHRPSLDKEHECHNLMEYSKQFNKVPHLYAHLTVSNEHIADQSTLESSFIEKCNISSPKPSFQRSLKSSTPIVKPKVAKTKKKPMPVEQFYCFDFSTRIVFEKPEVSRDMNSVAFDDIGGVDEEISILKGCVDSLLEAGYKGVQEGILITGPSGSGKTLLGEALSSYKPSLYVEHICCKSAHMDVAEVQKRFSSAENHIPSVIFLDNVDKVRKENKDSNIHLSSEEDFLRILLLLITKLDNKSIIVVFTAESDTSVPSVLRKPLRSEKAIHLKVPSIENRRKIFDKVLKKFQHSLTDLEVSELTGRTHGFYGGDLEQMCKKAKVICSLRCRDTGCLLDFEYCDLLKSSETTRPASVEEFSFEKPNVRWSDIGGMESVKAIIVEAVEWPLKYVEQFKKFKISPSKGILMYGPPGCCKTMMAKALAAESHVNFVTIKGAEIFQKYVGESEKAVATLFKKARSSAPCILFFDEIDILAPIRGSTSGNSNVSDRILTQLLVEIDGIDILNQGICIIAATNRPDMIDPSLLRPGRFDQKIYVPLPDFDTRRKILIVEMGKKPHNLSESNFEFLTKATNNFTGSEVVHLCHEAAWKVIQEDYSSSTSAVSMDHFHAALKTIIPRTTEATVQFYENYYKNVT